MRRVTCRALAILLLTGCANKLDFQEFSSPEGGFTVLLPGTPERKNLPVADLNSTGYGVQVRNGFYAVCYLDVPPDRTFDLDGAMQGVAKKHQGTIQNQ